MSSKSKPIHFNSALAMLVASLAVLVGLSASVAPAFADHGGTPSAACIRDAAGFNQGNICTANDVRIGRYDLVGAPASCREGDVLTVTLRAQVESGPERYDIGLWVDELGGNAQDHGNLCYRDYLHPLSTDNSDLDLAHGAGPFFNGEMADLANGDVCGDVQAASDAGTDPANVFPCSEGGGSCVYTFYEFTTTITCRDSDRNGLADLGTCTSWDNQISSDDNGACGDQHAAHPELETIPGTSSKCHCGSVDIMGLSVPVATIAVVKEANPTSLEEPGGDVTFTFTVINTDNELGVTINSLTDSIYGDLNGQGDCAVPQELAPNGQSGDRYACSMTTTLSGNAGMIETNVVTASGVDTSGNAVSDIDDATVVINDILPSIDVIMTASPDQVSEPGGDVTYTVTVTNLTTQEAVTLDSLVDSLYGDLDGQGDCSLPQTLEPGASYTCSFTASVEGNAFDLILNEVTATASDDEGNLTMDVASETVTILDDPSAIQIVKTATPNNLDEPGGDVTFTFEVTNLSLVDSVTLDSLMDSIYGDLTAAAGSNCATPQTLAPEDGTASGADTYTCSMTVYVAGDAGETETNVVTAEGTDDDGVAILDDDAATVTINDVPPSVTLDNIPTLADQNTMGDEVTFVLQVTNTSSEAVTITALTEPQDGETDFTACAALVGTVLAPGETVSCDYTMTYNEAGAFDNMASVTVEDNETAAAADSDDAPVTITMPPPDLTVIKDNDANGDGAFSDTETIPASAAYPKTVTYQVRITNNSIADATITAISDTPHDITGSSCAALFNAAIAAGETKTCSFTATFANADQASVTNTFSVTAANDGGSDAEHDTSTVILAQNPAVQLNKTGSLDLGADGIANPGDVIAYSLQVTNSGNVTLSHLSVTDPMLAVVSCPSGNPIPVLSPGATETCTGSYAITQADIDAGRKDNTALATGQGPQGQPAEDDDDHSVLIQQHPSLGMVKDFDPNTVTAGDANGGSFTLKVSNTGNVTLYDALVADAIDTRLQVVSVSGTAGANADSDGDAQTLEWLLSSLAPGQSETITIHFVVDASVPASSVVNVATVAAEDVTATNQDTLNIVVDIDLSIVKTFDPATVAQGDVGAFTLVVSNEGPSDAAGVVVTDVVHDLLGVTAAAVTSGAGDCVDTDGDAQTVECEVDVPASGSATVTVTYIAAPPLPQTAQFGAQHGDEFRFVFVNGYVLEGSTDRDHNGGFVTLIAPDGSDTQVPFSGGRNDIVFDPPADTPVPGVDDPAFLMHLSCSDPFTGGWGETDGPAEGVDVNWQIASFTINRYNPARGFFKTCGGAPNPFVAPNTASATGVDSSGEQTVSDDASVEITAPAESTEREHKGKGRGKK